MTVSLSLAESHLRFKLLVVPRSLFPPRSVSGVCCPAVPSARQVVQEPPSLFTDQSQTHQNAVNEHFPPGGLHFACTCGFSPGGQWLRIGGGGISKWEPLSIGVESQPVYGLGHISYWPDSKKPLRRGPLVFSSKCMNTQLNVTTLFAISLCFAWTHWSLEVTYGCVCTGACGCLSVCAIC